MRKVNLHKRRVILSPLYRIVSADVEFVLEGVSGMVKNGSMTVSWATGLPSKARVEYGYVDDDNLTTVEINTEKRYHEFVFPTTYVDTLHLFRVTAIHPGTGQELRSELYDVYVTSTIVLRSIIEGIAVDVDMIAVSEQVDTLPGFVESSGRLDATPDSSDEILISSDVSQLTVIEPADVTNTLFQTNITTTVA